MSVEKKQADEIWYSRCPVPSPLAIAVQQGWMEKALRQQCGLQMRALHESNNPVERATFYESPLPNSFRQGGSVPALWARGSGQETRVVGLSWTDEFQAIVTMPTAGITQIRELRGRRIGIPRHEVLIDHSRAAALRAFSAVLETEGLSLADVEIVDLTDQEIAATFKDGAVTSTGTGRRGRYSYTNQVRALARGEVDAVYVKDAQGAQATHLLGAAVLVNIGRHPDREVRVNNCTPRPLTVSQWLLDHRPDVVKQLLAQSVLAGRWAARHGDKVRTLIGRETGWSDAWVNYAYGEQLHQNLQLDFAQESVRGLGLFKDFLAQQKIIPADFDLQAWLAPALLQEVLEDLERKPALYMTPVDSRPALEFPPLH
ncbi:MAG: ABC transporter substrate-binding protein [Pedobacter sp.]|nr:ABC transporter substrate-binding protein [Pedobacter sp.]